MYWNINKSRFWNLNQGLYKFNEFFINFLLYWTAKIAKLAGRDFKLVNELYSKPYRKIRIEDAERYQLYTKAYNELIVRLSNI